jgi:hypothetical protein
MKTAFRKKVVASMLAALVTAGAVLAATVDPLVKSYVKTLSAVPVPELAAKAASLVKDTKVQERTTNAVAAIRAVIEISPTSTLAAVGSICRVAPAAAPDVVSAAVRLLPNMAGPIAKVAASAAPAYAPEIAKAAQSELALASTGTTQTATRTLRGVKGPTVGPPYTPGGGSPGEININQSGEIPPGGARYHSP